MTASSGVRPIEPAEVARERAPSASPPAAQWAALALLLMMLIGCRTAAPASRAGADPIDHGIVLFGKTASEIASFFQQTRCLLGPIHGLERNQEGATAWISYPSGNFGSGERRTTVEYTHRIRILEHLTPEADLDRIDLDRHVVVLAEEDESAFVYRLVGLLLISESGRNWDWDYFADKPELWFRDEEPATDQARRSTPLAPSRQQAAATAGDNRLVSRSGRTTRCTSSASAGSEPDAFRVSLFQIARNRHLNRPVEMGS
jgi:hypothetical protein